MLDDANSLDSVNDFVRSVAVTADHCLASTYCLPEDLPPATDTDNFQFSTITSSTVCAMLSALDVRKSVGPDGISARFLKEIAEVVAEPLTKMFNKSQCVSQ